MTGPQKPPYVSHETEYGNRSHHPNFFCFLCHYTKNSMAFSCVRCWNALEGDDFLCGECYLQLVEEMVRKCQ